MKKWTVCTLQTSYISPQGEFWKLAGGILILFQKLIKLCQTEHPQPKKKNVPNWAKIIGKCFAEFLFYGPSRPGGPLTGLIRAWPKSTLGQHWTSWAFPEHPFDVGPMCFWVRPVLGLQNKNSPKHSPMIFAQFGTFWSTFEKVTNSPHPIFEIPLGGEY